MFGFDKLCVSRKKVRWTILGGVLFLLLVVLGYFGVDYYKNYSGEKNIKEYVKEKTEKLSEKSGVLKVNSANFNLNFKKIPYESKKIEFTLSENIKPESVDKDSFQIKPEIDGNIQVKKNKIVYKLKDNMKKGKSYDIYLTKDIKTVDDEGLPSIKKYSVKAVDKAEVVKFNPEGELDNLSQNILMIFNMPVVPLTNLDKRDELPCPIKIEPEIEGACKWTTTSTLEFMPDKRFHGATDYTITLQKTDDLLYPLKDKKSFKINTPDLDFYIDDDFGVSDGIDIRSNYPVEKEEIDKHLKVFSDNNKKLKYKLSSDGKSNTLFTLKLKNKRFDYDTHYDVRINKGVKPKFGNRNLEEKIYQKTESYPFLNDIDVYQREYSSTGKLIDKDYISEHNSNSLPVENLSFNLTFEEEVPKENEYFSIYGENGEELDYEIKHGKKEVLKEKAKEKQKLYSSEIHFDDDMKKTVKDKKNLIFVLDKKLKNNKKYYFKISKDINKNMKKDIKKKFKASSKLRIQEFKFLSYSKSCLYFSNEVDDNQYENNTGVISISPEAKIRSVKNYNHIPYKIEDKAEEKQTKRAKRKYLFDRGYCPESEDDQGLWVINHRLNPHSTYKISITDKIKDIYENKLVKGTTRKVTTQGISKKDKYIYNGVSKDENVIPSYSPLVVDIQSINMDSAELEVCEMNIDGYLDYVENHYKDYYRPECLYQKNQKVNLKNNHWYLSHNRFNIEKDIYNRRIDSNFVLTRSNVDGYEKGDKRGRSFTDLYIRSNLNVTLEEAKNKDLLFTTDYDGNKVIGNLEFQAYKEIDYDNYVETDINTKLNKEKGVYEIYGGDFDVLVVRNDKYFGVLNKDGNELSNYAFDYLGGESTSNKNYLYLYTDRPIYKPGDKVHFKGILREFAFKGYTKSPIESGTLKVYDEQNNTIAKKEISVDKNSNFTGNFNIPDDASLGKYDFRFYYNNGDDTVRDNADFYIEEYKKPSFKVKTESDKSDYSLGEKTNIKVKPRYYFGGKMKNTKGEFKIMTQNYYFDAKEYSNYQFGKGYSYFRCVYWGNCDQEDSLTDKGHFKIGDSGNYKFDYNFPESTEKGEKIYKFIFKVTDPDTKKTISKTVSKVLHKTDGYVGIKAPYHNTQEDGIEVDGVALDWEVEPKKDAKVKLKLIKKNWKSVKKQGVDGVFYNHYTMEKTDKKERMVHSNDKGEFEHTFDIKESGEYMIKAIYTGNNGKSFSSSVDAYVAGDDFVAWRQDNNDVTELVREKVMVNVGDTQELVLKSPVNTGKALFVIEKDDGILDYFVHDIHSYGDKISIDVKDTYYPNFYVKAFLIGNKKNNPLPVYKRALAVTKVNTKPKKLNVEIDTDKKRYLPGGKVKVEVKATDQNGNPVSNANGNLAVVDESVLALMGNPKKNPFAYFYDMKRYLGVDTYTSLKKLIEKLEIKDPTDGSKGGDGQTAKGGDSKKKRGDFRDTALWTGNFQTNKEGKANIAVKELPDNLTTRKVESIVNTTTGNKIGIGWDSFKTSKRIMINPNFPRFLGSSDEIVLNPVVFNKSGKDREFKVSLSGTNFDIKDKEKKLFIKSDGQKTVNFRINVKNLGILDNYSLPTAKISIKAESKDGNIIDNVEKELQIYESSTSEKVRTVGKTEKDSFDEKIYVKDIKGNRGNLDIKYSATLLSSLDEVINSLQRSRYSSISSKFGSIMPSVFLKRLHNSLDEKYNLKNKFIKIRKGKERGYVKQSMGETIQAVLGVLDEYQKSDGGFVYWKTNVDEEEVYSDFGLTIRVIKNVGYTKNLGYDVNKEVLEDAVKYSKDEFYENKIDGCEVTTYNDCEYSKYIRMRAVNAILTYDNKDYEAYKMRKKVDKKSSYIKFQILKVDTIVKLLNSGLLKVSEEEMLLKNAKETVNDILNNEVVFNPRGAYIGRTDPYDRLENTSALIEVVSKIGNDEFSDMEKIVNNGLRWIMQQKNDDGGFGSDRKSVEVIKGLTSYLKDSGELKDLDMKVNLKLNSEKIASQKFNDKNKFRVYSGNYEVDTLKNKNAFNINKRGKGSVYYDLALSYYLPAKDIDARDEGFSVNIKYYKYSKYQKIKEKKEKEMRKFRQRKIPYSELEYPKDVFYYLDPVKEGKVGDMLIAKYDVIVNEIRDDVMLNSYIPSGAEILNPNLETQKGVYDDRLENDLFSISEYQKEKYFGYKDKFYPGKHEGYYVLRLTHEGEFVMKPTKAYEMKNHEVFGRSRGKTIKVNR